MTEAQFKKRRVKTGCLNCKKRHKKCDELKPHCSACKHRNDSCEWPVAIGRFNKRSVVTFTNVEEPKKNEDEIQNYSKTLFHTLSESDYSTERDDISSQHKNAQQDEVLANNLIPALESSPQNSSLFSEDNFLMYSDLHNTLRDFMFSNASTSLEFQVNTPSFNNILNTPLLSGNDTLDSLSKLYDFKDDFTKIDDVFSDVEIGPTEEDKFELLKNYIYEVAPWLDMFDNSKQFGLTVPDLASESDALLNSIYAISSRQLENTRSNYPSNTTVLLYRKALKSLIPTVKNSINIKIVTACVILCVFEMMSSSPLSWRRHLEGCAALFKATGINGFSDEYKRSLFWCYARMDVDAAVIADNSTIIPCVDWLPEKGDEKLFLGKGVDMYSNYIVYLCAKVLNLQIGEDYEMKWESILMELNEWYENRPKKLRQVLEVDKSPFPLVLYTNGPSISANQIYHMLVILMMDNKPRGYKFDKGSKVKSSVWHAKQIVSISLHNPHHGCWNNALQPLWIAGKLLSGETEQKIILNLLSKIERTTGWIMKFRLRDLQRYWKGEMV